MEKLLGTAALLAALTLAFIGLIPLHAPEDPSLPPQSVVGEVGEFARETERQNKLDDALARNSRGRAERFRILNDLEAGSIGLDEAFAGFGPLNEEEPLCWNFLLFTYPDRSEEEILGYQMMVFAFSQPRQDETIKRTFIRSLASKIAARQGKPVLMPAHVQALVK